jgi:hypothetical protein
MRLVVSGTLQMIVAVIRVENIEIHPRYQLNTILNLLWNK